MKARLTSLLREPLVHFLLAGLLVFALFGGGPDEPTNRTITIDEPQIRVLTEQWIDTWHRAPTQSDIDGLIRDHIKDEVYYREALALGMEEDDIIIRKRLRSKFEFLVAAQSEAETPSIATLQAWLEANRGRYVTSQTLSFEQVFVGGGDPMGLLAQLKAGANANALRKPLSVPFVLTDAPAEDVDRQFGDGFAAALAQQQVGVWSGPIMSGFGSHIVRVSKRGQGTLPPLARIRQKVENDWRQANRKAREDKAYQALLDSYTIKIAKP
jgi:peptidyl-prolyl cis-trans isomerase C